VGRRRLADEARYAEWLALWTEDAVYWVPATIDPDADPERHLSHIYDNRARLTTPVERIYAIEDIRAAVAHAERGERADKILVAPNGQDRISAA
jgi:3-phenylpropionate/cinnamic acid dioxygenase small subunit